MQSGTVHIEIRITQNNTKLPNVPKQQHSFWGVDWGGVRWGGAAQTTKLKTPEFY